MPDDMQSRVAEVQRLATETEAEAVSEYGEVRVVAGPSGVIKEIDLRMKAFQLSGVELGEEIVKTIKSATTKADQELSQQVDRIMNDLFESDEEEGR